MLAFLLNFHVITCMPSKHSRIINHVLLASGRQVSKTILVYVLAVAASLTFKVAIQTNNTDRCNLGSYKCIYTADCTCT